MDRQLLENMVIELQDLLGGTRVAKVHQPTADTLVLRLWTGRENLRLLISTGKLARIHLTEKDYPNPFTPPRFCQLLRSRLKRIDSISQVGGDRIIRFDGSGPDGELQLYVELFGSPGNMLLVDAAGVIIDSLVRKRDDRNQRSLLPGEVYRLPQAPKDKPSQRKAPMPDRGAGQSLSQVLDDHFYPLQFKEGQLGDRGDLQRVLTRERKRLTRRLANIAGEGEDKETYDDRRQLGDLLLANLYQVKKGMTSITVSDYATEPPAEVVIPLDPKLSPQNNAQALFKRYKKEKRGIEHIERRTAQTEEELAWLNQVQLSLDEAETPEDLQEVAAELKQAALYSERRSEPTSRRKLSGTPNLRQATSPGGFTILWGRNNRANDYLTTRVAAAHDYWFHAQGIPGCHLVLKRDSSQLDVPTADLEFAARIAAGYSRARNDHKVEVICCQARDVYKVKGAHPGQVNLRQFDSLRVEPLRLDEEAQNE